MKRETYEKVIRFFERSRWRSMILELVCKILPVLCGTVYLFIGVGLLFLKYEHLARYVAVPAAGVVIVTVLRKLINRRRPYEALGFSPFLKYKEGKGQSFPSRHTALCVLIAFACWYIFVPLGIVMFALAVIIALSRLLSGMHYPSDVISGFFLSLIIAVLGFCVV